MKYALSALAICCAAFAQAQDFSANDVSILLKPPVTADDPRLPVTESMISTALAAKAAAVVEMVNAPAALDAKIDSTLLSSRRGDWHVAAMRIDPGAPGLDAAFLPFGRNLQVRLTVQPVNFSANAAPVRDEAVHLIYTFGATGRDGQAASCPCRFTPDAQDIAAFNAALTDLATLKAELANAGIVTDGAPLGVHPGFATPETADLLVDRLSAFMAKYLTEDRLSALSVAGLPPGKLEPWIFLALRRSEDGFAPVPGPAIAQGAANHIPNFTQRLSFAAGPQGEVVPPGRTRNLLPVDCLANFLPDMPQPDALAGVSTSELFGQPSIDPARAREIAAIVADPAVAHFFNTDCVSCHTETRRQIDAGPDSAAIAAMIATDEGIAAQNLPDSPKGPAKWNSRAFGWYPGLRAPAASPAHATVTRRAARETAEVVACLNKGDWTQADRPCLASDPRAEPVIFLDQGWSDETRRAFYHGSQGGAIMPLSWFLALERPGTSERFATPENLARYGALPSETDAQNPHGLPVGFAVTGTGSNAQVGLNCAACHVGEMVAGGRRLRVDGGPAAFDFDAFVKDLSGAMRRTAQLDLRTGEATPQLRAFIANVAAEGGEIADPKAFVGQVLGFTSKFAGEMAQRSPAHPSGPGRVDALTQIVNSVAVKDLGLAANLATPSAPTSYPPLWLADRLEFVQWNLAAADPLARNIGQALGVFGQSRLSEPDRFSSSANLPMLGLYEEWIAELSPPRWTEELLGPIDEDLAYQGRDLFAQHCESCHNAPPYRETNAEENLRGQTFIKVGAIPHEKVKTDGEYTRAFTQRWVATGDFGKAAGMDAVMPSALFLGTVVGAVATKARNALPGSVPRERPAGHADCKADAASCVYRPPLLGHALKSSPLLGLWASGPYLHNGSVRTVYQVISPPSEREASFMIGARVLDPDHLGFANEGEAGAYLFDTTLPGNGNGGHAFPSDPLTHEEKMGILEYLKDPERFPLTRK